jgi:hypothetical protein
MAGKTIVVANALSLYGIIKDVSFLKNEENIMSETTWRAPKGDPTQFCLRCIPEIMDMLRFNVENIKS